MAKPFFYLCTNNRKGLVNIQKKAMVKRVVPFTTRKFSKIILLTKRYSKSSTMIETFVRVRDRSKGFEKSCATGPLTES